MIEVEVQDLHRHGLFYVAAFTRVVDTHSFTAAARQLGLSKATVSNHVTMLEERLGARLLNRTTRSLNVTQAGAQFYEHCQKIIAELSTAESEIMDSNAEPSGRIRVSAPIHLGGLYLAPVLGDFLEAFPNVEIDMVMGSCGTDPIGEGNDVAIRIARKSYPGLCARRLAPSPQIVCAAPSYIESHGRPAVPEDLADHHGLIHAYLTEGDIWRLEGPEGPRQVRVTARLRANNGGFLRVVLLSGFGLALMPAFLVREELKDGRLINLLPDYQDRSYSLYAVYAHCRKVSTRVRVFVDYLERRFGDPTWCQ